MYKKEILIDKLAPPSFLITLIEKILLMRKFQPSMPVLFILGLPRSGTTLVYQYIVHRLHVAYFTNGVGKYPQSPCFISYVQNALYGDYKSDFQSNYGKVTGHVAPREAGSFWGRFFGYDEYIYFDQMNALDVKNLRNMIGCMQYIFGNVPFVNKNIKHMLRIDALQNIFPNAYFLVVRRNTCHVALSMLRGRYANDRSPEEWWSVKPEDYEDLIKHPVEEQVAGQLKSLQKRMNHDLAKLSSRVLYIDYEDFCRCPEMLISMLLRTLGPMNFKNPPEESFQISCSEPKTQSECRVIELLSNGKYFEIID